MQIPKKEIERSLLKKGFVKEHGDHNYFYHEYEGKRTGAYAKTSYGSKYKDYGINLIKFLKKQLKLDQNDQAIKLLKCPMNKQDYETILQKKGIIPK